MYSNRIFLGLSGRTRNVQYLHYRMSNFCTKWLRAVRSSGISFCVVKQSTQGVSTGVIAKYAAIFFQFKHIRKAIWALTKRSKNINVLGIVNYKTVVGCPENEKQRLNPPRDSNRTLG